MCELHFNGDCVCTSDAFGMLFIGFRFSIGKGNFIDNQYLFVSKYRLGVIYYPILKKIGFTGSDMDHCLCQPWTSERVVYIGLFVDGNLLIKYPTAKY